MPTGTPPTKRRNRRPAVRPVSDQVINGVQVPYIGADEFEALSEDVAWDSLNETDLDDLAGPETEW